MEFRTEPRLSTFEEARVTCGQGEWARSCVLADVSRTGATLIMTIVASAAIWLGTVVADMLSFDLYWTRMIVVAAAFAAILLYVWWRSPQDET